jgi:hypothetical protein
LGAPIGLTAAIRSLVKEEQEDDEEDSIIVEDTATNSALSVMVMVAKPRRDHFSLPRVPRPLAAAAVVVIVIDDHLLQHPRNEDHEKWDPFKKTSIHTRRK